MSTDNPPAEPGAAGLDERSLAEARELIGVELRNTFGSIEITREAIELAAIATGSRNPMYFDRAHARRSRWGGLLFPPGKLPLRPIAPKLRGVQWMDAGADWQFIQPIKEGDLIAFRGKLIDAVELRGRTVPRMILQKGEITYRNQRDQIVAVAQTAVMRVPRSRSSGGMSYAPRSASYSAAELSRIHELVKAEHIRGQEPRFWEDVSEGDETPPFVFGPLRLSEITFSNVGGGAHVYQLLNRRRHPGLGFGDPESAIQDDAHQTHFDSSMAHRVGMPGMYDYGPHRIGLLGRVVDWLGDDAFVTRLSGQLRRPNLVGDTTFVTGHVSRKFEKYNGNFIELDLEAQNQLGELTMPGKVVAKVPSRSVARNRGPKSDALRSSFGSDLVGADGL